MFNPSNLDEVCVQATHLEAKEKQNIEEKGESEGKGKEKGRKWKGKKNASIKKEKEKLTCKNYSNIDHDEDHYWQLHPKLKLDRLKAKEKGKTVAIVEKDLGSYSRDETKITAMGLKGQHVESTSSSNSHSKHSK